MKLNFKEYTTKAKALFKCGYHKLYASDIPDGNGAKIWIVSDDETMYMYTKLNTGTGDEKKTPSYYECFEKGTPVAMYFDLDIKVTEKDNIDEFDKKIKKFTEAITKFFKSEWNIDINYSDFVITSSGCDDNQNKHSIHIKIIGHKFSDVYAVKYYVNEMKLDDIYGSDLSVYRVGTMLMSYSSKIGQNRPLKIYESLDKERQYYKAKHKDFFMTTLIRNVKGYNKIDESKYNTHIHTKEEDIKKMITYHDNKLKNNIDKTTIWKSTDDEISNLIKLINIDKFLTYENYARLCVILKTEGNFLEIFKDITKRLYALNPNEWLNAIEQWNKTDASKYDYGIWTLRYWAKKDNPDKYELLDQYTNFDPKLIYKIIDEETITDEDGKKYVKYVNKCMSRIISYMNKYFLKLNNHNGVVVFCERRYEKTNEKHHHVQNIVIMNDKKFTERLKQCPLKFSFKNNNGKIEELKGNARKLSKVWQTTLCICVKESIVFDPDPRDILSNDYLNTYQGMAINKEMCEEYKDYDITPFTDHLLNIWCKGNKKNYEYLINLLAFYVQKPYIRSGVAIVLEGNKGSCKSCVVEKIFNMYGIYGKYISNSSEILGNFNSKLKDTLLCYVDELTFVGNVAHTNRLRTLIRLPQLTINERHIKQYDVSNDINFIIDSNNTIHAKNYKNDHRYFTLTMDDRYAGNGGSDEFKEEIKKYFEDIRNIPAEAVGYFLYNFNILNFMPMRDL